MAFLVDIRSENRSLHLLYKALFEIAEDRADFVSRLFSRDRPPDAGAGLPVEDLFARYAASRRRRGSGTRPRGWYASACWHSTGSH